MYHSKSLPLAMHVVHFIGSGRLQYTAAAFLSGHAIMVASIGKGSIQAALLPLASTGLS